MTYLYEGEFQHRDSTGASGMVYPGEVNWMVAGRGVTHSERTSPETRAAGHRLSGVQTWVALPRDKEEIAPFFEHHTRDALPCLSGNGKSAHLILGTAYGERSPVSTFGGIFYVDVRLDPGAVMPLPDEHGERAAFVSGGSVTVAGQTYAEGQMLVFKKGTEVMLHGGPGGGHLMLLGGEPLAPPRHLSWNFVSSRRERLAEAAEAWRAADFEHGPFRLPPDDAGEFIPLPG